MRRHERRALDELESQLHVEDPALARKLTDGDLPARARPGPARTLGFAVAGLAVLCLFLGEAAAFLVSGALAGALLLTTKWSVHPD